MKKLIIVQCVALTAVFSGCGSSIDNAQNSNPNSNVETSKQAMISAAHNGAIYLLHSVSSTNAAVLVDVIDSIRSQGYEFS